MVTEQNNAEPPLVLKAREYIEKHKNEELSLADVAKAAGASVFHFCKVFHKATGLKFTDYVARVRLEDARNRLLESESSHQRNRIRRRLSIADAIQSHIQTSFWSITYRVSRRTRNRETREKPLRSLHHSISAPCARVTVSILAKKLNGFFTI